MNLMRVKVKTMEQPKVIFCDDYIIAVNKASGYTVQGEACEESKSYFKKLEDEFGKLYVIHRLDKPTTGVLVYARSKEVASEMGELFQSEGIKKIYLALSSKKISKKQGWVKGSLVKSRRSSYKLSPGKENHSVSYFLNVFLESIQRRLFFVRIYTGKTHQVRVHLKSLGAPILGDHIYGTETSDRMYLHSYLLEFTLNSKFYKIKCLPTESGNFWKNLSINDLDSVLESKNIPNKA